MLTSLQLRSPDKGLVARWPSDEQTSGLIITHPLRNGEELLPVRGNLLCIRSLTGTEHPVAWLERAVGWDGRVLGDATCKLCTTHEWERRLVCRIWIEVDAKISGERREMVDIAGRTLIFSLRLKYIEEVESTEGSEAREVYLYFGHGFGNVHHIRSIDIAQYLTLLQNWLWCVIHSTQVVP